MKKYILFSIVVLAVLWVLGSTQPTEAATINAASCSYADVSVAIAAALAGDTVSVPSGSCTWPAKLTITKGINLIGAGVDVTIINSNVAGTLIEYNPSNRSLNSPFRFSGFTIDFNNKPPTTSHCGIYFTAVAGIPQTRVRIDNNKFKNALCILAPHGAFGVVDNNTFDNSPAPVRNDFCYQYGLYQWENYPDIIFGADENNLYFEDNIFTNMSGGMSVEQCAQRYAFRNNQYYESGQSYHVLIAEYET